MWNNLKSESVAKKVELEIWNWKVERRQPKQKNWGTKVMSCISANQWKCGRSRATLIPLCLSQFFHNICPTQFFHNICPSQFFHNICASQFSTIFVQRNLSTQNGHFSELRKLFSPFIKLHQELSLAYFGQTYGVFWWPTNRRRTGEGRPTQILYTHE